MILIIIAVIITAVHMFVVRRRLNTRVQGVLSDKDFDDVGDNDEKKT